MQPKGIKSDLHSRREAVRLKTRFPNMSFSAIGRKIGKTAAFVSRWVAHDQQFV